MRPFRRCCRPGCKNPAVATLTYVYADSTAVVGPLAAASEPHSWDLCEIHSRRITAPRGWDLLRYEGVIGGSDPEDDDLTALAEAVREAGRPAGARSVREAKPARPREDAPDGTGIGVQRPRTGRRGHLRVLPDPEA